jgi:hypothetical protein
MKLRWADRCLLVSPVYFTVCTSEKLFHAELTRLKLSQRDWPKFIKSPIHATTHFLEYGKRKAAIVCLSPTKETGIEIAALLCHEAVHIWQFIKEEIGEREPSAEMEAYAIQHIVGELMLSYQLQRRKSK